MWKKKGQFVGGLSNMMLAAIMFVGFIASVAFGALIVNNIGNTFTAGTVARNVTDSGLQGLRTFGTNSTTIATVIVGVFILVLLITGLFGLMGKHSR